MRGEQYLIALDLDGTLLTDDKKISHQNKEILAKVIDEGHIVVIATGRSIRSSIDYYYELSLQTPMVNSNGAVVHHPKDKTWGFYHEPIPYQTFQEIVQSSRSFGVYNIMIERDDTIYFDQYDEEILEIFHAVNTDAPLDFVIGEIDQKLTHDPTTMLIYPHPHQFESLQKHFAKYHGKSIEFKTWGPPLNIIEITKYGVHKAVGLQKVAEHYKIPQERIIAFGDQVNDLEMIEYAGVGVAMENAIDELKEMADYMTRTNEENGVQAFLEQFLKIKVQT